MTDIVPPRIPAGMRDILPKDMLKRDYVMGVIREIFERYGFEPLQTSAIENTETLTGKYGPDGERLIYKAWYGDKPGGEYSLRYDLSVPLARVAAMYPDLPRPFKRYQIAPVWRADRPAKGRYREFYQCDVDIVGSSSMLADAEIVALAYEVLNTLGFTSFTISLNNRKLLDGIGQYAGVPTELQAGLYRSIDKLDKIGIDGVRDELLMVGVPRDDFQPLQKASRLIIQGKREIGDGPAILSEEGVVDGLIEAVLPEFNRLVTEAIDANIPPGELQAATRELVLKLGEPLRDYYGKSSAIIPADVVERLLKLIQIEGEALTLLNELQARLSEFDRAVEGIEELRALLNGLEALGVPSDSYAINFAMVRGLEYYTASIFEIAVSEPKAMPSITGGGRFDELIGLFAEQSYPAVGISFGIERIIDVMTELDMFPDSIRMAAAQVLVTTFNEDMSGVSLAVAADLRRAGINTTLYFEGSDRLGDQIGYASSTGIPFVVIIGPDEAEAGQVTVRKLGRTRKDSEERTINRAEMAEFIRNW